MANNIEQLRSALRQGDSEAFRQVVRELTEPLYRYVQPQLKNGADAQDVVQTAFIRLWKHRKRLKPGGSLRTFCFFIATNLVRDSQRRSAVRSKRESEAAEMRETEDTGLRAQAREAFDAAKQLPEELRQVVLLRFGQGFTATEAAVALGIPEGTVKTRQRRALTELRERLASVGVLPAVALPELERSLGEGAKTSVEVPTSLVTQVEALVMASIATKAGSGGAILVGVLLLLLLASGVGVIANVQDWGGTGDAQPLSATIAPPKNEESAPPLEIGSAANSEPKDVGKSPDETPGETPPSVEKDTVLLKVHGRVTDADGNGVSAALVRRQGETPYGRRELEVTELEWSFKRNGSAGAGETRPDRFPTPEQQELNFAAATRGALTDERGNFELAGEVSRSEDELVLYLDASAQGFGQGMCTIRLRPSLDQVIQQDMRIEALARFVTFRTNPALSDKIYLEEIWASESGRSSSSGETQLLPDGIQQVEVAENLKSEGGSFYLKLLVPGFLPATVKVPETGKKHIDLGTIELDEGRRFSGVVVDTEGLPIQGAVVRGYNTLDVLDFWSDFESTVRDAYDVTDKDGKFHLTAVLPEANRVSTRHADYAEAWVKIGDERDDLRLVMPAGARVEGLVRFLDGNTPQGKTDLRVVLCEADLHALVVKQDRIQIALMPAVNPDENFIFRFERVPPGEYVLQAVMNAGNKFSAPVPITVGELPVSADVEFGAGASIFGVLTDPDGPVPSAKVTCAMWKDDPNDYVGWEHEADTRTDAEGRFSFADLRPGKYGLVLDELERGFLLLDERVVQVDDARIELNIRVGSRPEGNRIVGKWDTGTGQKFFCARLHGFGHLSGYQGSGIVDDNGNFEITGIPPGRYYLYGEMGRLYLAREEVVFEGRGETLSINQTFTEGNLTVSVRDEQGATPQAKVWMFPLRDQPYGYESHSLSAMGGSEARHFTRDGSVMLGDLVDGTYVVYAQADGYAVQTSVVELSGDTSVELVLKRPFGTVSFTTSADLAEDDWIYFACIAEDVPGRPVVFCETKHGLDEQPQLAPGRYTLLVQGQGMLEQRKAFEVTEGKVSEVEIPIVKGAEIVVAMTADGLSPAAVQMARLDILDVAGRFAFGARGVRRTDGRSLAVTSLAPGNYTVRVQVSGYAPVEAQVVIGTAESKTVEVQLKRE